MAWQTYANRSRRSSVRRFNILSTQIRVEFKNGAVYTYTYSEHGKWNVEDMKDLAVAGRGLNTFINKNFNWYTRFR